jgi:hypothetical protein
LKSSIGLFGEAEFPLQLLDLIALIYSRERDNDVDKT